MAPATPCDGRVSRFLAFLADSTRNRKPSCSAGCCWWVPPPSPPPPGHCRRSPAGGGRPGGSGGGGGGGLGWHLPESGPGDRSELGVVWAGGRGASPLPSGQAPEFPPPPGPSSGPPACPRRRPTHARPHGRCCTMTAARSSARRVPEMNTRVTAVTSQGVLRFVRVTVTAPSESRSRLRPSHGHGSVRVTVTAPTESRSRLPDRVQATPVQVRVRLHFVGPAD